jgi:hypothetical protein
MPAPSAVDGVMRAFEALRSGYGGPEHYAIVIESPPTGGPLLTPLHPERFSGDLLSRRQAAASARSSNLCPLTGRNCLAGCYARENANHSVAFALAGPLLREMA